LRNPKKLRLYLVGALTLLVSGLLLAYSLLPTSRKSSREDKGIIPLIKSGQMSLIKNGLLSKTEIESEKVSAATSKLVKQIDMLSQKMAVFDITEVMKHIKTLSQQIGVRKEGTSNERRAANYISKQLEKYGYEVKKESFPLPNGLTSQNIIAFKEGKTDMVIILGAHYDSKSPSPGANDNASGVATLLELARVLKFKKTVPTIEFVFFGAEEMIDKNPDHHHYGSRYFVNKLSSSEKEKIIGMISVDMIGYGDNFHVRTMKKGSQTLSDKLLAFAKSKGINLTFRKDRGKYGWSDHEPFELAGIPSAWLEWRNDPYHHTRRDNLRHLNKLCIKTTGEFLSSFLLSLSEKDCKSLKSATD
jgi:putative aminopeptidase FrvX